jgi:sigma-B regulation protein RsbU (phosphoserine phosphatase)
MVVTKTLIKNYAQMGLPVSEVFSKANTHLCEGNEAGMFVTAFMGVLNLETGLLKYVNAGHNKPCIRKQGGDFIFMKVPAGLVLAGMEDFNYKENSEQLAKGDIIFLYTDGVTDATDAGNSLFSDSRLLDTLNQNKGKSLNDLLNGVKDEIDRFVGSAPQFDDITMLAVQYEGGDAAAKELTLPAVTQNLNVVLDFINKHLQEAGCPAKTYTHITLAVEEIFINIANYAYHPGMGDATIRCEVNRDSAVAVIQFMDSGFPYNPLEKADPDISLPAEGRNIGGLGIFLVKKNMDRIEYEYKNGKNILTIVKSLYS